MGNKHPAPLCRAEKIVCNESSYRDTDGNIAAIDFGTTSVSLAYTTKGFENILTLPLDTKQSPRILNTILLKKEDDGTKIEAFGENARQSFARQKIDNDKDYIYFERVKMSLKGEQAITREITVESFSGEKFYLVEVIAFILKYLRKKLIDRFSRSARPLKTTDFDWVITVPAIWDARGKRMMREAAYLAGLLTESDGIKEFTPVAHSLPILNEVNPDKLTLALEPESAALYSQENVVEDIEGDKSRAVIGRPKEYMVIDIGGGTVDITAHVEVGGHITVPITPTGNAWGGTQINEAFSKMLQQLVDDPGYKRFLKLDNHSKQMASLNDILYKEFESQKTTFGDCQTDIISIALPNRFGKLYDKKITAKVKEIEGISYDHDNDTLYIEKEVVESQLFGPTLDGIIKCTLDAIEENKYKGKIFYLVGGFGGCKYVHQKVEDAIKQHHNSKARVLVPESPQLAVATGAVIWRKNPGQVKERKSDATYGIGTTLPFNPKEHDEHYKYYDEEEGQDRCDSVFCVFLEKGELANENEVITIDGTPPSQSSTEVSTTIYSTTTLGVQYIKDKEGKNNVSEICQIIVDTPNPDNLPREKRIIDITMDFSGTEIQAKAKYRVTGKEVQINFDYFSPSN